MGHQPSYYTASVPLQELEDRCALVLARLFAAHPASASTTAEQRVRFTHRGVTTDLTLRCSQAEGIVVRTRIGRVVEEFIGFGPVAAQVLAIAADAYDWNECPTGVYEFGQGGDGGLMFELGAVSDAPGPDHKYLVYRCSTVAELACFLDALLGTYTWDLITADAEPLAACPGPC